MSDEENLFARWSRRKRKVAEEAEATPAAAPATEVPPEKAEPEPGTPEEEAALLERLQLPVPESMKIGDDFSVFMKSGVPGFLRKRALRVLWRSNPVLANLDGLNDYDADFNSPELTKKIIATGYKIGRGFLPPEPSPEIMQDNGKIDAEEEEISVALEPESEGPDASAEDASTESPDEFEAERDEEELSFNPKRMRFDT